MEKVPLVFADRGFSLKYPENTLIAFQKAHTEANCNGIYLNVHITRDREVVVIHDATLERTTNGSGYVKDFNYEDIAKLDAGSKFDPAYNKERIPLLGDVLDYAKEQDLFVIIELKNYEIYYDDLERITISLVRQRKMKERVMIVSYNHLSMEKCKSIGSEIETGLLAWCPMIKSAEYMAHSRSKTFLPSHRLLMYERNLSQDLHDAEFKIYAWGAHDLQDMIRLITVDQVDAIITQAPDTIAKHIKDSIKKSEESLLWG